VQLPDVHDIREGARRHELLNSASAMAFHVLFALVPLALFVLAVVGFVDLERVWRDAADALRPNTSPAAFTVIDDTASAVLQQQRPFWLTAGAALAIWRLSAAMRATMGALDRIYDADRRRALPERLRVSILLSLVLTVLLLGALAAVYLIPVVIDEDGAVLDALSFVVRWGIAAALLLAAMALTLRHAPATPQPLGWVSVGTALCATAWIVSSLAFGVYIREIADYGSAFGAFATVFVLLTYLYLACAAFLVGAEIDTQLRALSARPAADT